MQLNLIIKSFKGFPEILFCCSLRGKPSCHILSRALDIASNWLTQESPGLNLD